jgi:hypothetical protein
MPASFANRPVSVRVYPGRIVVAAEGQIVCEHRRVFARSHQRESTTTVFDWRHYLAVIQRKPGALPTARLSSNCRPPSGLCNSACSKRRAATARWSRLVLGLDPGILALVLQHDEQAVLAAVELALEAGIPRRPIF